MTARMMKSKSPVRKEAKSRVADQQQEKTSIFKGPVNQEFFKRVEKIENGIDIVTANAEDEEGAEGEEEQKQDRTETEVQQ